MVDYLKFYQYYPCIREDDDDEDPPHRKYVFMTTVAMPAFEQDSKSVRMSLIYHITYDKLCHLTS